MQHRSPWRALRAVATAVAVAAATVATATSPAVSAATPAPAAASAPVRPGYWLAAADGGVYAFGTASYGQLRPVQPSKPVVGVAPTPDGGGYWMVASDGGIFAYGDAAFHGSTGSLTLNRPVVGMAGTATGAGYWLVASDGGIFAFGDAGFHGSTGSMHLNRPIVGMAATPTGRGYWLVASDGGIFAFGDAGFHGSTGSMHLNQPIVGMAATPSGNGYWLVARDGGIFAFGDAQFDGSTGSLRLAEPIVGMAPAPAGGYWLTASDGGMFAFGGAPYLGSTGSNPGPAPVVGIAATGHASAFPPGAIGSDYSWPQCSANGWQQGYPPAGQEVAIVGVDNGLSPYAHPSAPFNPCLPSEAANAGANLAVYLNVDQDQPNDPHALSGPKGSCPASDLVCTGYNWGWNNAIDSVAHVQALGLTPTSWWLDVEAPCGSSRPLWMCGSAGQQSNAAVITGAVDALHSQGLATGIYSTYLQWPQVTGGSPGNDTLNFPGLPIWIAWAPGSSSQATESYWESLCTQPGQVFAEGAAYLIQWIPGSGTYPTPTQPFDADYACPTE